MTQEVFNNPETEQVRLDSLADHYAASDRERALLQAKYFERPKARHPGNPG